MVRQEEEEAKQGAAEEEEPAEEEEEPAAGTGEDLCHLSGYNKETARVVSLNKSSLKSSIFLRI